MGGVRSTSSDGRGEVNELQRARMGGVRSTSSSSSQRAEGGGRSSEGRGEVNELEREPEGGRRRAEARRLSSSHRTVGSLSQ